MRTILIFDVILSGHHLEYIHHIYEKAIIDKSNRYIYVVPDSFEEVRSNYGWEDSDNCEFDLISKADVEWATQCNRLLYSYRCSLLVRRYAKKYNAANVFLNIMMPYMPFLILLLPKGVKASGIIYRIYLYEGYGKTSLKLFANFLFYKLMARNRSINRLLVLNDRSSVAYFNRTFRTGKFRFLPDPVCVSGGEGENIRKKLGISNEQKVLLHFGGITERKGSMHIMDSLKHLSEDERKTFVFIFAGKIYADIKKQFYKEYKALKEECNILMYDEFCSYKFINDLCVSCDAILVPYGNTTQSSGLIGYASHFGKPIVGPSQGLLGKLIRRNHLGLTLDNISGSTLATSYKKVFDYNSSRVYAEYNIKERFCDVVMDFS